MPNRRNSTKILLRACLFFVLEVLLTVKAYHYSGYYLSDSLTAAASWIFPLIATLLALFLGWVFSMVIQHSKKIRSFYLLGLNTGFAIYFVLFCHFMFESMEFNRRHGYNPQNQAMMRENEDFRYPVVSTGFELLQSKFMFPRNLQLRAFFVKFRDTVIDGRTDSIATVYYTYRLDGDDRRRFSKIDVAAGKPVMLEFNVRTDTSSEYVQIKDAMEKERRENLAELQATIRDLPDDSISRILKQAVNEEQSRNATPLPTLSFTGLTGNLYVFTTWHQLATGPYPANGMYLVTDKGIALIDGPWDSTQFQPFMDSLERRHHKKIVLSIATHFHADRTGAFDFLRARGVATYSTALTRELCRQNKQPMADHVFAGDTVFRVGNVSFSTFYPGQGHTKDNIVVWFPADRVLFGGCFVKSTEVDQLGNIDDANLAEWPHSVQRLMDKYPHAAYIVPGHQGWTDRRSLEHTLDLLRAAPAR